MKKIFTNKVEWDIEEVPQAGIILARVANDVWGERSIP